MYIKIFVPHEGEDAPGQFLVGLHIGKNGKVRVLCPQRGLRTKCEVEVQHKGRIDNALVSTAGMLRIATPKNVGTAPMLSPMEPSAESQFAWFNKTKKPPASR